MARRTATRERMLDTAAELFHTQGYHATGLNQLLIEGGAPKGSLYFHFPGGKEQLAAEAVALSGQRLCAVLRSAFAGEADPGAGLAAVLDHLAESLTESGFRRGCPLSTVALDAAADSEPIRKACADGYASWQRAIEDALTGAGVPAPGAARLAVLAVASLEGALLLARTRRDLEPLRQVGEHLAAQIAEELNQAGS
ncbi:TetR/AcrR family transcriptional regulator [Prauserella muralis]|uniref:TetR family transcriptional regulator n=1 Tax=Prauserella muralis TaxID=588067 RepID=A0A2V4B718_9PSEU|nr:TetR/AcrR family transcriptional regulator [Prauserella muralis]PXY30936.1 TetR family transcriptional regulator [Prauserella muralis]TWE14812.1 TetR family transcriptional regulator [Prauserella muralis]